MSQFINPTDYDATVHREILDALTRQDAAIIDICEERAISEMKSYLAPVYDVETKKPSTYRVYIMLSFCRKG